MIKKLIIRWKEYKNRKEKRISLTHLISIGSEEGETMERLKKDSILIAKDICSYMPLDMDLPEGYRVIIKPNTTNNSQYKKEAVLVNLRKHISLAEPVTRDMVLFFTRDLADGLHEKFNCFLDRFIDKKEDSSK